MCRKSLTVLSAAVLVFLSAAASAETVTGYYELWGNPRANAKAKLKRGRRFKVTDKGCDPFDMCMKVKGAPRGAKKYFSMDDWIIESHHGLGAGEVQQFLREQVLAH